MLRSKLLFLIALTVLVVLALQGIADLPRPESWYDGA
jgi:hypothetical protein